ncbi:MAG: hypothetical protein SOY26_08910, partial [Paludibacteraceae bacterium]|nr:hypothetical protein [Paludibacteraceae bacterium]
TDADGLPDEYEIEIGLDPSDPADAALLTPSGYTYLETYLNGVADGTINKADYEHLPYISFQPSMPQALPEVNTRPTDVVGYDFLGRPCATPLPSIPYISDGKTYILLH